jgi:phage gp36-like protein
MGYCTTAELEDRLTAALLNRRIVETGADRARVLEGYISRASARVDAALSRRYATPAPPSALLADVAATLCLWQIEADRGKALDKLPPNIQLPYEEAMKTLAAIAEGSLALPGAAAASEGAAAGLSVSTHPREFAPDSPGMEYF